MTHRDHDAEDHVDDAEPEAEEKVPRLGHQEGRRAEDQEREALERHDLTFQSKPREHAGERAMPAPILKKKLLAAMIASAVVATSALPTLAWAQTADANLRGKAPANRMERMTSTIINSSSVKPGPRARLSASNSDRGRRQGAGQYW